jgi:hypothetical protein
MFLNGTSMKRIQNLNVETTQKAVTWKNDVYAKMDLLEIGFKDKNFNGLAKDYVQWWSILVMFKLLVSLQVP